MQRLQQCACILTSFSEESGEDGKRERPNWRLEEELDEPSLTSTSDWKGKMTGH